LKFRKEKQPLI